MIKDFKLQIYKALVLSKFIPERCPKLGDVKPDTSCRSLIGFPYIINDLPEIPPERYEHTVFQDWLFPLILYGIAIVIGYAIPIIFTLLLFYILGIK